MEGYTRKAGLSSFKWMSQLHDADDEIIYYWRETATKSLTCVDGFGLPHECCQRNKVSEDTKPDAPYNSIYVVTKHAACVANIQGVVGRIRP